MKPQKKFPEPFEEIIFRDRNKSYGAYFLRKTYPRTVVISVVITLFAFSFIVSYSRLAMKPAMGPETIIHGTVTGKFETPPAPPKLVAPPSMGPAISKPSLAPKVVDSAVETEIPVTGELTGPIDTAAPGGPGPITITETPENQPVIEEARPEPPRTFVQIMPAFPGGEDEMMRFLARNVVYPSEARESGISGTVVLEFIVEKDGSISGIKVVRSVGGGCDEAAVRAVKMMPNWTPGLQQGNPVRVWFHLPVKFTLR